MAHRTALPVRLAAMVPVMIREDWLGSYQDLMGVEKVLSRLSQRLTNGDRLLGATEEIKLQYRSLEANFFPRPHPFRSKFSKQRSFTGLNSRLFSICFQLTMAR